MVKIEFIESYIKHDGSDYEWSDNHGELIRCKNCRYWQDNQEGHYPHKDCPWDKGETPDADDYCSFAEKRVYE